MNEQLIKNIVQEHYGIDITLSTRKRHYVEARAMYFTLLRKYTRLSLEAIGKTVGRHHASVLYNIQQLEGWLEYDKKIYADYEYLSNTLAIQQQQLDDLDTENIELAIQRNYILKTNLEEAKQKNFELAVQLKAVTQKYIELKEGSDKHLLDKYGLI